VTARQIVLFFAIPSGHRTFAGPARSADQLASRIWMPPITNPLSLVLKIGSSGAGSRSRHLESSRRRTLSVPRETMWRWMLQLLWTS
jgi:hypothetical protein